MHERSGYVCAGSTLRECVDAVRELEKFPADIRIADPYRHTVRRGSFRLDERRRMRLPSFFRLAGFCFGGAGILLGVAGCGGQSDFADVTTDLDGGEAVTTTGKVPSSSDDAGAPTGTGQPGTGNEMGTPGGFVSGGMAAGTPAGGTTAGGTAAGGTAAGGFIGGLFGGTAAGGTAAGGTAAGGTAAGGFIGGLFGGTAAGGTAAGGTAAGGFIGGVFGGTAAGGTAAGGTAAGGFFGR